MPRLTTIKNLIEAEKIKTIEQETPRIPEEERASNNLSQSDHTMCDFLFEDYTDGKGHLTWKQKTYRLDDEQLRKFRECLMKDKGEV